jgi:hypothetical protein
MSRSRSRNVSREILTFIDAMLTDSVAASFVKRGAGKTLRALVCAAQPG